MTTPRATRASNRPVRANLEAATGNSNEPGTRRTVGWSTAYAAQPRKAPASRPFVTASCQDAATIATRTSAATTGAATGAPEPAISDSPPAPEADGRGDPAWSAGSRGCAGWALSSVGPARPAAPT